MTRAESRVEQRLAGDSPSPLGAPRFVHGTEVHTQTDARVQHHVEVAFTGGREKGVDDFALSVEVGVRNGVLTLDAAARAARGRPPRRAIDDRRDLVEGHAEDVVQHEREPLGR